MATVLRYDIVDGMWVVDEEMVPQKCRPDKYIHLTPNYSIRENGWEDRVIIYQRCWNPHLLNIKILGHMPTTPAGWWHREEDFLTLTTVNKCSYYQYGKIHRSVSIIVHSGAHQWTIDIFNIEKVTLQWLKNFTYLLSYNEVTQMSVYIHIEDSWLRSNNRGEHGAPPNLLEKRESWSILFVLPSVPSQVQGMRKTSFCENRN